MKLLRILLMKPLPVQVMYRPWVYSRLYPPIQNHGITLVPLQFAGEALGSCVIWEKDIATIQIASR